MTLAQRQVFEARVKSFLWRAFGVAVIAGLNWAISNVADLQLPIVAVGTMTIETELYVVTGLGLVLGEVTKYFNSNVPWLRSQNQ